jgi:hypothetical protein
LQARAASSAGRRFSRSSPSHSSFGVRELASVGFTTAAVAVFAFLRLSRFSAKEKKKKKKKPQTRQKRVKTRQTPNEC